MKSLPLAVVSALLLTACGGADDRSDSSGVERFDPAPYIAASEQLNGNGYTGRWVGVINVHRERTQMVNAQVSKTADLSRLESLIIRNRSDEEGGGLEMSNCNGGFDPITITGSNFVAENAVGGRHFSLQTPRHLSSVISRPNTVRLSEVAYIEENVTIEQNFYRVSDNVSSMGFASVNWSDTEGDTTFAVHCAAVARLTGGNRIVAVSHEDDLAITVAEASLPFALEAYITQKGHEGKIVNYLNQGEQNVQFSQEGPDVWRYNYSATTGNGLGASGQVVLDLLP